MYSCSSTTLSFYKNQLNWLFLIFAIFEAEMFLISSQNFPVVSYVEKNYLQKLFTIFSLLVVENFEILQYIREK